MKKLSGFISAVLIVGLLALGAFVIYRPDVQKVVASPPLTEVLVVNSTDSSVVVYLTIGADTNYVTDVNGIFGITGSGLKGFFILDAGDTVSYTSPNGKGFSGNIAFDAYANNCADSTLFPNGINMFEFSLNNNFLKYAQETIDISCVSGVNSKIACTLTDSNWNAGDTTGLLNFENSYLYDNVFRHGVFPYGCDSCTVIVNPGVCPNHKKFSQPQSKSICNIQRSASLSGGQIIIQYQGVLTGEILNK